MNSLVLRILAILALAPFSASAQAIPESGGVHPFSAVGVAVKFGVAGAGFDLATPVASWLNVRGGASFFSYSTTLVEDGTNVSGAIKFQNGSAMLDIFPFRNRFRISGGATVFNKTGFNAALAVPAGNSFTVGNTDYTSDPSDPIHGTGTFNFGGSIAPRVSIGFGNMTPRRGHWGFETEAGFQYITRPTVVYVIHGSGCTGPANTNCGPISQSSINQEQTNLQNDLSGLRFFPILSIGLSYKLGSSHHD